MSRAKVPNPYKDETYASSYFEQVDENGIRCIGAALSIDSNTHVVICAPDAVVLKRAWNKLTKCKLDLKRSSILLYQYEPEKVEESISKEFYWFYHAESSCCFLESHYFRSSDGCAEKIGRAIEETKDECRALLRKIKMPRSEIENTTISTAYPDDIPF